ncbi:MAG: type IV pilus twitching motility protein PilT [Gammaproteobacteria bacterium]|nr:type IV pilus twitching motility protein PilT [Gammaproteobacteria bacterium]
MTTSVNQRVPDIDDLLRDMVGRDGSDLHYVAGDPPRTRVYGDLSNLINTRISAQQAQEDIFKIMPDTARNDFEQRNNADFAHAIEGLARFRVNVFRHLNGVGAIFRAIPSQALTIDDLKLPTVIRKLCHQKQGMVLVTGKTGSGKSTTLAAMIHEINMTKKGHILTVEDPIEFTHERRQCLISQREVGRHTKSFAAALHSAMREDPDVILVGEMRDYETMSVAVTAAETGILVMGTLHTNGAASTVDRIVNTFPADKQSQIRSMLSTSLRGVVSQQLCKRADDKGRIAALEVLVNTSAAGNIIRQGKLDQLENVMQSGADLGMQAMDATLRTMMEDGLISEEEALEKAYDKDRLKGGAPKDDDFASHTQIFQ